MKTAEAGASLLLGLGAIISCASLYFNARYGYSLGSQDEIAGGLTEGHIYALVSTVGDLIKIALPFVILRLLLSQGWAVVRCSVVFGAAVFYVALTTYSLFAAFGELYGSRADTAGARGVAADTLDATRKEMARLQAELAFATPDVKRGSATWAAEVERHKLSPIWGRTSGCTDATVHESQSYCQTYFALKAGEAQAARYEAASARLMAVRADLERSSGITVADAQANALSAWLGVTESEVQQAFALLLAAVIEFAPPFIPVLVYALSVTRPAQRYRPEVAEIRVIAAAPVNVPARLPEEPSAEKPVADEDAPIYEVGDFYREHTRDAPAAEHRGSVLYEAYRQIAGEKGLRPVSLVQFGKLSAAHVQRERQRHHVFYRGRAMKPRLVGPKGVAEAKSRRAA